VTATKKIILCSLLFALCSLPLSAQSTAAELENLLAAEEVTCAQAARFILQAADALTTRNPIEAFDYALEQNWLPEKTDPDGAADLKTISLLLMNSFELKGGIMYSITKGPRYAYRELVYKNIVQGRTDPDMTVTGERLVFYTGRVFSFKEGTFKNTGAREWIRRGMLIFYW
jgi:hypothetical protein